MAKFPSFLEYLNDKGSVVDKPKTEIVPDYNGPDDKSPPNSKVPYKTPTTPKAAQKGEKGFAELGDEKLKYEPDTSIGYEVKKDVMKEAKVAALAGDKAVTAAVADYKGPRPDAPKGGKPYVGKAVKPGDKPLGELGSEETKYEPDTDTTKKKKTESFINKTKGMSLSDFTKYMLKECGCGQVEGEDLPYVTAYATGKFQPHPPEVIRYISALAGKNEGILENLVSTIVSTGHLSSLLKAVFSYPQAYEELTSLFSDENEGPSRCKSFAGAMNNSYGKFLSDQEGLYESVSGPMGFDLDDDEEESRHHEDDEDLGDEDHEDLGDEDHEDLGDEDHEDLGDEDHEDLEDEDHEDLEDEDHEDLEDEDHEDLGDDEPNETPHEEPKPKRLKKKFAHHHLLDAMKNHEHMFKAMRGI
jgi:hypothetical protein